MCFVEVNEIVFCLLDLTHVCTILNSVCSVSRPSNLLGVCSNLPRGVENRPPFARSSKHFFDRVALLRKHLEFLDTSKIK